MEHFLTLTLLENRKMWKRMSTKIMPLILVACVVGFCFLLKAVSGYMEKYESQQSGTVTQTVSGDWQDQLQAAITADQQQLDQLEGSGASKMAKTQIGSLKKTIAEDQYRLDHDMDPAKDTGKNLSTWGHVVSVDTNMNPNFGGIIAMFMIIVCSAAVAGEFSEGTMKMMISRPYHRWEILTAKLITTVVYGLMLFAGTFILTFVMMGLLFGFKGVGSTALFWTGGKIIAIPAVCQALIVYGLDFLTALVYTIFAFLLAAVTRSRAMAIGFSLFLLLVGGSLFQLLTIFFGWGRYVLFTVTNFSGFLLSGSPFAGTSLGFALILSLIYSAVFLFASYYVFAKRDI